MRLQEFLLFSFFLSSVVRSDYPPPSEHGHAYYGQGTGSSMSRAAGTSFVSDWSNKEWSILSNHNLPKCLDIPTNLTLCRDIGYGQMRLPNLLEHDTLNEVIQQAATWVRLAQARCHPDTQVFLCSLFAPVCLDEPVWPCKTLCEAVKSGCESMMLQYGFPWPDMLQCDNFPPADPCIGIRQEQQEENRTEVTCPACSPPADSYNAIMKELCSASFVMRVKMEHSLVDEENLKVVVSKKKKVYRSVSLKSKNLREGTLYLDGGANCYCPRLDTVNGRRKGGHVIVAGNRTRERLMVTLIQDLDLHGSKNWRRALRDIRKNDSCKEETLPETGKAKTVADGKKKTTSQKASESAGKVIKPPIKGSGKGKKASKDRESSVSSSTGQPSGVKGRAKEPKQRGQKVTAPPRPTKKPPSNKNRGQ